MSMSASATAAALPTTSPAAHLIASNRIGSLDAVRGLVIVLMTLDHVRDYFTNARFDPLDLAQTTPELFLTRWITHLCAPIFIFLAGTSAYLMGQTMSRRELSGFLLKRGLWLVVLEFTLVAFAWSFRIDYPNGVVMQVIWAIGVSMIALAGLVHLPLAAIAALAAAMIFGHNLLDGIAPAQFGDFALLWNILHVEGVAPFGYIRYPLIPWIGVMAAGYVLGQVYQWEAARRQRLLLLLGAAALALFVLLRAANGYGDPKPWTVQGDALSTVLAFIDVEKYPPSLLYLAVTLGIGLLLLAWFERIRFARANPLAVFGRVPLFAYVLHIAIAHALAGSVALAAGQGTFAFTERYTRYPESWGFGLPGVYLAWLAVLVLIYPACRWFAAVKSRRRDWWLSYL